MTLVDCISVCDAGGQSWTERLRKVQLDFSRHVYIWGKVGEGFNFPSAFSDDTLGLSGETPVQCSILQPDAQKNMIHDIHSSL